MTLIIMVPKLPMFKGHATVPNDSANSAADTITSFQFFDPDANLSSDSEEITSPISPLPLSTLTDMLDPHSTPAPNLERISNYAKPKLEIVKGLGSDVVGDDEFGEAGDLVGQDTAPVLDTPVERTEDNVYGERDEGTLVRTGDTVELSENVIRAFGSRYLPSY